MVLLHALAGYGTSGVTDLMRDFYWADAILRGEALPLRGPPIYDTIELGPWWYYVIALALAVAGSLAGAAAVAAGLAALKYWLAWRLGHRLGDPALGLLFVVALIVPGWSAAPLGFPTHTALVETAIVSLALAALGFAMQPAVGRALLFGLAGAFCIHAHPTTIAFVVAAGAMVLVRQRNRRAAALLVLAVLVVAASLLPPLLARDDAAMDFGTALSRYAAVDVGVDVVRRAAMLAAAIALGGGWHGMLLLTDLARGEWIALAVLALALAVATAGWIAAARRTAPEFRIAAIAIAAFAGQAVFLALIRPITPLWMTATLLPPFALALAAGWRGFARLGRGCAVITGVAVAGYVSTALIIFGFFVREVDVVRVGRGGNVFMDAAMPWITSYDEHRIARTRLRRLERAARQGCAVGTLHGDLGAADEMALGLPTRRACGDGSEIRYAGRAPGRHLAGYRVASWCSIGLRPTAIGAGFGFSSKLDALAPDVGGTRAILSARQVDPIEPLPAPPLSIRATTPPGSVVALGGRFGYLHPLSIDSVAANGSEARLVHHDLSTRFYRCDRCSGDSVSWEIRGRGSVRGIDFVALHDDPAGVDPCPVAEAATRQGALFPAQAGGGASSARE